MLSRSPRPATFRPSPAVSMRGPRLSLGPDGFDSDAESQFDPDPSTTDERPWCWTEAEKSALHNILKLDRGFHRQSKEDFFESLANEPQFRGRTAAAIEAKAKRMGLFTGVRYTQGKGWQFELLMDGKGGTARKTATALPSVLLPKNHSVRKALQGSPDPAQSVASTTTEALNITTYSGSVSFTKYEDEDLLRIWQTNKKIVKDSDRRPIDFWGEQISQFPGRTAHELMKRTDDLKKLARERTIPTAVNGPALPRPKHQMEPESMNSPPNKKQRRSNAQTDPTSSKEPAMPTNAQPPSSCAALPEFIGNNDFPNSIRSETELDQAALTLRRFNRIFKSLIIHPMDLNNVASVVDLIEKTLKVKEVERMAYLVTYTQHKDFFHKVMHNREQHNPLIPVFYEKHDVDTLLLWSIKNHHTPRGTTIDELEASLESLAKIPEASHFTSDQWCMVYWTYRHLIKEIRTYCEAIYPPVKSEDGTNDV
ncbi:hypothetical protein DL93DRAFT_2158057 [Clavulina sp. PMI_390]|nr:hypothetical protein DL93DRAFT_2158057 [Clavulina sp. PMI_390]